MNEAPAPAGATVSIPESAAVNSVVVTSIPSNDPDAGATAAYSIEDGNQGGKFAIVIASGQIKLAAAVDFEALPAGGKFYSLLVRVFDGSLSAFATVTVNVFNVNEAPVTSNYVISVNENSPVGSINSQTLLPIVAYDPGLCSYCHCECMGHNALSKYEIFTYDME